MSQSIVRAAGFVLMTRSDSGPEVLLMRHADRWDFPKGHCEAEESFLETAIRETEEETGIQANQIDVDDRFSFDLRYPVIYRKTGDQVFEKQVRYFLGRIAWRPEIVVTEHESFEWLPWNPPHQIQNQTIDPVLAAVEEFLADD